MVSHPPARGRPDWWSSATFRRPMPSQLACPTAAFVDPQSRRRQHGVCLTCVPAIQTPLAGPALPAHVLLYAAAAAPLNHQPAPDEPLSAREGALHPSATTRDPQDTLPCGFLSRSWADRSTNCAALRGVWYAVSLALIVVQPPSALPLAYWRSHLPPRSHRSPLPAADGNRKPWRRLRGGPSQACVPCGRSAEFASIQFTGQSATLQGEQSAEATSSTTWKPIPPTFSSPPATGTVAMIAHGTSPRRDRRRGSERRRAAFRPAPSVAPVMTQSGYSQSLAPMSRPTLVHEPAADHSSCHIIRRP